MSQVKLLPIFWIVVYRREWCSNRANGAPRCGGASEISISCCCASEWRQPSLFGDDTHAVVTRPKWAREHGGTHGVVPNVGGLRAWPIDRCSNKDAGRSECETLTPCAGEQAPRPSLCLCSRSCSRNPVLATWRLESGLPPKTLGCYVGTSVVACLRVVFMNWRRSFFQTREAEGTEYTRVPGMHAPEEAVQELVRVNVSGRDFTRPPGATQRR